jgi:hypothetical protein
MLCPSTSPDLYPSTVSMRGFTKRRRPSASIRATISEILWMRVRNHLWQLDACMTAATRIPEQKETVTFQNLAGFSPETLVRHGFPPSPQGCRGKRRCLYSDMDRSIEFYRCTSTPPYSTDAQLRSCHEKRRPVEHAFCLPTKLFGIRSFLGFGLAECFSHV